MNGLKVLVFLILFILKICNEVDGGCNLSLENDLGNPSPVYLHNGGFLAPTNATGDILLRRSETIRIACPGDKRFIVLGKDKTGFDVFDVKCVKDKIFRSTKSQWVGNLSEVKCNAAPWFTTEKIGSCYNGYTLYKVGFKVDNTFYTTYEACFNEHLLHTLYVKHQLEPKTKNLQRGRRPQFIEGNLFGKIKISKVYEMANQKKRIREIFGNGMEEEYITQKEFLSRGHLAPRADFPQFVQQRASFCYVNAAPQWMRGNAGDWAALEEAVRRRAMGSGASLHVYTGSLGVLTLGDVASTQKELYLYVDENNNGIVPVPLYMFKVVYEPAKKSATVFISINSSYYNRTMIEKLTFCRDVCENNKQFSWLKWRPNDGTHSFCCTYEDFVRKFNVLPKLNVERLFF